MSANSRASGAARDKIDDRQNPTFNGKRRIKNARGYVEQLRDQETQAEMDEMEMQAQDYEFLEDLDNIRFGGKLSE